MKKEMTSEYICMHYGEDGSKYMGAVVPPIFQTSNFELHYPYEYSRAENPNFDFIEKKIALLEHAEDAILVSCGASAGYTCVVNNVRAGDHVIMVASAYCQLRATVHWLERYNVDFTFVRGTRVEDFIDNTKPNTKLFYMESPSSFLSDMQDFRVITAFAKERGIVTVTDNTCATPLHQTPLDMGVDLVLHSASKYIGGHSDCIAGFVAGSGKIMKNMRNMRIVQGNCSTPMQAWLLLRGLRTMPMRVAKSEINGMAVAKYLEQHPAVAEVHYEGLESHPQRALYLSQMSGSGGLLTFKPKDMTPEKSQKFIDKCRIFKNAVSWGGYESLVYDMGLTGKLSAEEERVAFGDGLMRIYCGVDDTNDLLSDLEQALKAYK